MRDEKYLFFIAIYLRLNKIKVTKYEHYFVNALFEKPKKIALIPFTNMGSFMNE